MSESTPQNSIPLPFAIGETVWHARPCAVTRSVPCPVCAGKRVVTVILGSGESCVVACEGCDRGWGGSDGLVTERVYYQYAAVPFVCQRVIIHGDPSDPDAASYTESGPDAMCYTSASPSTLFRDKAACEAACVALSAASERNLDEANARHLKRHKLKMPRLVAYYVKRRKELTAELARIEACLHREQATTEETR